MRHHSEDPEIRTQIYLWGLLFSLLHDVFFHPSPWEGGGNIFTGSRQQEVDIFGGGGEREEALLCQPWKGTQNKCESMITNNETSSAARRSFSLPSSYLACPFSLALLAALLSLLLEPIKSQQVPNLLPCLCLSCSCRQNGLLLPLPMALIPNCNCSGEKNPSHFLKSSPHHFNIKETLGNPVVLPYHYNIYDDVQFSSHMTTSLSSSEM